MAVPCFRYRYISESRATKHPVVGNEKLSPMGWSHCAYGWRPSAEAIIQWWNVGRKEKCIKTKKRFRDTIKYYLKQSRLPVDQWEKMASDRSKWRKLIQESIESFENSRMQYSANKRLIRKGEQGPASSPQSHHANCDVCGKLCLSFAGLNSHLRKYAKSILHPNNVTTSKTDRLYQFCGKICRSLAGLKSHLRTHAI